MVTKDDGFESIFNKAKNTTNRFQDWEFVMSFCDRVTEEPEGPLSAVKVLVDKLKSEDEDTQLLALAVLEACVKNCGVKFHNEVGKFKLLNELIKLISPKYSANKSSEQLKSKVRGLFFQWRRGLPKQGKILDAYEMLKKEGLIDDEGNLPDNPPPQVVDEPPRDSIIKDEKEIETLEKLLKSKNPQDLVRANEMIQDRYKRENTKLEKLQHRSRELDLVDNNAKLLEELLGHYSADSSQPETDLIEELKKSCVTMKEKLQKIAEQCTDDDVLLNKLCTSSDALVKVLDKYDTVMSAITQTKINTKDIPALISSPPPPAPPPNNTESLLDSLIDLDLGSAVPTSIPIQTNVNSDISSLLSDFGPFNSMPLITADPIVPAKQVESSIIPILPNTQAVAPPILTNTQVVAPPILQNTLVVVPPILPNTQVVTPPILQNTLVVTPPILPNTQAVAPPILPNTQVVAPPILPNTLAVVPPILQNTQAVAPLLPPAPLFNLDLVQVTNNSIQITPNPCLIAYNSNNVIITVSTGRLTTPPLEAPELKIIVVSMMNLSPFGVENFLLHAATSKESKLKLFPSSLQSILPYNPFHSCPVLSQIILIQSGDEDILLKLKFSFSRGGRDYSDVLDLTELKWI